MASDASGNGQLVLRDCCARYLRHCLALDVQWSWNIINGDDFLDPEDYAVGIHDNDLVLLKILDGEPCPWCERGVPEGYLAAMEAHSVR